MEELAGKEGDKEVTSNANEKATFSPKKLVGKARLAQEESEKLLETLITQVNKIENDVSYAKREVQRFFERMRDEIARKENEVLEQLEQAYIEIQREFDDAIKPLEDMNSMEIKEEYSTSMDKETYDRVFETLYNFNSSLPNAHRLSCYSYKVAPTIFPTENEITAMLSKVGFTSRKVHTPPVNLRVLKTTSFTAGLQWDKRYPDEEYKVQVSKNGTPLCTKMEKASICTIATLDPSTAYTFSVMAKGTSDDDKCWSEFSRPVEFKTGGWESVFGDIAECGVDSEACTNGFRVLEDLVAQGRLDNGIGMDFVRFVMDVGNYHVGCAELCVNALKLLCGVLAKYFGGLANIYAGNEMVMNIVQADVFCNFIS